jgi:hypothetical protein
MRRRWLAGSAAALATMVALSAGLSIRQALATPGTDGTSVRLAEWGRDHGLGPVVTMAESIQYRLHPPATGGIPDLSLLAAGATVAQPAPQATLTPAGSSRTRHPGMDPPDSPALPGEGVFVPLGRLSRDYLVQTSYVRPDHVHTSYLTGVAWMSHLDRFVLHPGYAEPGPSHHWTEPNSLFGHDLSGLLATFNSGFKLADANGGYYDHGQTAGTLTDGAASFVVYTDGHATVGTWGKDVRMGPRVAFVRQNLKPLISDGNIAKDVNANVQSNWGATIGGDVAVWRSGVGVTAQGDIVYAAGDALTVKALADVLNRAGSTTAMQLDINQTWVSYMTYQHHGGKVIPKKLAAFQRPASRYLRPTSRDFIAVYSPSPASA